MRAYHFIAMSLSAVCCTDSTIVEIQFDQPTNTVITNQFSDIGLTFSNRQPFEFQGPRVESDSLLDLHNSDQSEVSDLIMNFDSPITFIQFELFDADEPSSVRLLLGEAEIFTQQYEGGNNETIRQFIYLGKQEQAFDTVIVDTVNVGSPGPEFIGNIRFANQIADALLGDINCDGSVNLLDINPFIELVANNAYEPAADINGDTAVNLLDVLPFVELLQGD